MEHHHPPDPTAAIVLDIGGDVGAAVVRAPDDLDGEEIEIRRASAPWDGTHVAFHQRLVGAERFVAAVFPNLRSGRWEARLRGDDASPIALLDVRGGRVSRVEFPGRARGAEGM